MLRLLGVSLIQAFGANIDPITCFFGLWLLGAPSNARYERNIADPIKRALDNDEYLYFLSRDMDVPRVFQKNKKQNQNQVQD